MLEEALNSPHYPLCEISQALLSFQTHELPTNTTASEVRFLRLYPQIINRLFALSEKDSSKGMLRALSERDTTDAVAVERLLRARGVEETSLVDAIVAVMARRPGVKVGYPLSRLPGPTRKVLKGGCVTVHSRENAAGLVRVLGDHSVVVQAQKGGSEGVLRLRHVGRPQASVDGSMSQSSVTSEGMLMLSLLDYYFASFLHFPTASSSSPSAPPSSSPVKPPSVSSRAPYVDLFQGYLRRFLPHHPRPVSLSSNGTVLLRLMNEIWLEGENTILTTAAATQQLVYKQTGGGEGMGNVTAVPTSVHLFDIVQASAGVFQPLPPLIQQCVRQLVVHLITDPALSPQEGPTPAMMCVQRSFYNYLNLVLKYAPVHTSDSPFFSALEAWLIWIEPWNVSSHNQSYLSTITHETQKLLRPLLSHPTLSSLSTLTSHLPPPMTTITIPSAKAPSSYSHRYKNYIIANYHFYITPLVLFLRRSRELDFSGGEWHKTVAWVSRVTRVFSPAVMDVLSGVSATVPPPPLLITHESLLGPFVPPAATVVPGSTSTPLATQSQVDTHQLLEEIVIQYNKKLSLDLVQQVGYYTAKFMGLRRKDQRDIDSLTQDLKRIVGLPLDYEVLPYNMKRGSMLSFSPSYDPHPSPDHSSKQKHFGFFSERGREDVLTGKKKCSALDVAYIGDPMNSPIQSFEIPILVTWLNSLSVYCNKKMMLPGVHLTMVELDGKNGDDAVSKLLKQGEDFQRVWFRINLRFLADVRHLALICVFGLIWKVVCCFK